MDAARAALLEITPATTIGELAHESADDGVLTLQFASLLPGYPDWFWTVSVAHLDGLEPSVLEVELLPSDSSIVAPDWVPWSDRLAEYRQAQEAAGEAVDPAVLESDGSDDDSDDDDLDDEIDELESDDDLYEGIDIEEGDDDSEDDGAADDERDN